LVFCFENYWTEFEGFQETVDLHWHCSPFYGDAARTLSSKFKQVRKGLKAWSKELSRPSRNIHNANWVIALLDGLEDARYLSLIESNFRKIVKRHLAQLLEAKRIYWKQRATMRFVKFRDENTKIFQAMATHSKRRNSITELLSEDGSCLVHPKDKKRPFGKPSRTGWGCQNFP
jgi:hypothetical protein